MSSFSIKNNKEEFIKSSTITETPSKNNPGKAKITPNTNYSSSTPAWSPTSVENTSENRSSGSPNTANISFSIIAHNSKNKPAQPTYSKYLKNISLWATISATEISFSGPTSPSAKKAPLHKDYLPLP